MHIFDIVVIEFILVLIMNIFAFFINCNAKILYIKTYFFKFIILNSSFNISAFDFYLKRLLFDIRIIKILAILSNFVSICFN